MALPNVAIQTALIARYRGDTTLQGLILGSAYPTWNIFGAGGVPTNQAFPFVSIFPITSQLGTALAMGTDAVDTYMQVSIFTQSGASGGLSQARSIASRIYALTQKQALDLSASGFSQFFILFENEQELQEPDGITQQIVHRYKLMTQG